MATAGPGLQSQATSLTQRIQRFTNKDLQEICRRESLPVSGTKAVLQKRIGDHVNGIVNNNNGAAFNQLRDRITELAGGPHPPAMPPAQSSHSNSLHLVNGQGRSPLPGSGPHRAQFHSRMTFKDSPFIMRQQLLAQPMLLATTPSGKGSSSTPITLNGDVAQRMRVERDLKILIFAAPDSQYGGQFANALVDVAFPQHIEVKVNGDEVRHNFKGLKNKPGSTKPADITDKVRKNEGYKNTLTVTYAYTDKASPPPPRERQKWIFEVHLVRKHTAEDLAKRLEHKGVFSKETVLRDMQRKAEDPDIIATSSVMSLKDPVSASRIILPCRSTLCSHNGCFDASSFLQLQEQAPTWACPLCSKTIHFEALHIDQYFQEILQKTSSSTDQVTIEPDGRWHIQGASGTPKSKSNGKLPVPKDGYDDDSDDDIVEVKDPYSRQSASFIKDEALDRPSNALFNTSTPPVSARLSAVPGSGTSRNGTNKRKSEVIDLTLSSDDEDPVPPPKRHAVDTSRTTTNGFNSPYTNGSSSRPVNGSLSYGNSAHSRPSNIGMPIRYSPSTYTPTRTFTPSTTFHAPHPPNTILPPPTLTPNSLSTNYRQSMDLDRGYYPYRQESPQYDDDY